MSTSTSRRAVLYSIVPRNVSRVSFSFRILALRRSATRPVDAPFRAVASCAHLTLTNICESTVRKGLSPLTFDVVPSLRRCLPLLLAFHLARQRPCSPRGLLARASPQSHEPGLYCRLLCSCHLLVRLSRASVASAVPTPSNSSTPRTCLSYCSRL